MNSIDESDTSFIDTLINNEQKIAISQYAVQEYLQEIWQGELHLKAWQFILFFASFVLIPPLWFMLSMPVEMGLNKVPVVKVIIKGRNNKVSQRFHICSSLGLGSWLKINGSDYLGCVEKLKNLNTCALENESW